MSQSPATLVVTTRFASMGNRVSETTAVVFLIRNVCALSVSTLRGARVVAMMVEKRGGADSDQIKHDPNR